MESKALPPVFAVPLSKSAPGGEYPEEIKQLMEFLTNNALRSESIFRRSPNSEHVKEIRAKMNERKNEAIACQSVLCFQMSRLDFKTTMYIH